MSKVISEKILYALRNPKIIFDKQLYVMTDLYICIMISPSLSIATHKRIEELDFLKSIFILLMVAFHLLYFADHYPLLKQWVYTFHMPGFLLISGYLMPVNKGGATHRTHFVVVYCALFVFRVGLYSAIDCCSGT